MEDDTTRLPERAHMAPFKSCIDDVIAASRMKYSFSKNRRLRFFNNLTSVDCIIEPINDINEAGLSSSLIDDDTRGVIEREHRVYALLAKVCTSSPTKSCIEDATMASSTDNFPGESILNTFDEREELVTPPTYWSSTGQHTTSVPETLLYKLKGDLCVVNELSIQPFKAYFQPGRPIYTLHIMFVSGWVTSITIHRMKTNVWTYTSQQFPMAQGKPIAEL